MGALTETVRRDRPATLVMALQRIDALAADNTRVARIAGRNRRRKLIREWKASEYGLNAALRWIGARLEITPLGGFMSFDEAVRVLRKRIRAFESARRDGHWSWNPGLHAELRSRLRVAVYFNRHAAALFARRAA